MPTTIRARTIVLGIAIAAAAGLAASEGSAQDKKSEAKQHFQKGVSLFKNDDFEGALVEFKAAYSAKPHYTVRYNIGICLFKLHRYAEAADEMNSYLKEGGKDVPPDKKGEIEEYLDELTSLVGTVMIKGGVPGAKVYVDGKQKITLPQAGPFLLNVGEYLIEVKADGYEPWETTLSLPGGVVQLVEVELQPVAPKVEPVPPAPVVEEPVVEPAVEPLEVPVEEPVVEPVEKPVTEPVAGAPGEAGKGGEGKKGRKIGPAGFWTGFTLTCALAIGAGAVGGVGLAKEKEYEDYTGDKWKDLQAEGKALELATNVLWGVTGAAGLVTLILAFVTDWKRGREKVDGVGDGEAEKVGKATLWVSTDPEFAGLGLRIDL